MEREVNFRIQCGWNNWRKVSGVICDKRVPVRLKGKVHKAVVRLALIYGLEAAPLKMNAAEMKMLRWMVGVTRRDRSRNEYIRRTVKVVEVSKKIKESRVRRESSESGQWVSQPLLPDASGRCGSPQGLLAVLPAAAEHWWEQAWCLANANAVLCRII
ncbi:uncharacterized protein LOC134762275 [Penaeus indicus]|uniref:uncharacterized protein LOC134762275 n=1 Tax=Penaeus indicus TaxID=29960 RepID=UPI00300D4266